MSRRGSSPHRRMGGHGVGTLRKDLQDFRLSLAEVRPVRMYSIRQATALGLAGLAFSTQSSDGRSSKPAVVESPGGNLAANLVYSPALGRVLALVGSAAPISPSHDSIAVWGWDGSRWQRMPGSGPLMRRIAAADYDVSRRRLILHGGLTDVPSLRSLDDLWEWDGESWSRRAPTLQTPRDHHSLVYDAARATSVMFGGAGGPLGTSRYIWSRETWEWNGVQWSRLDLPGPAPRARAAMIYDARRSEVIQFGGVSEPDSTRAQHYLGDTWRWNGTSWQSVAANGPTPRYAHAMAFDDRRGVALMYGGEGARSRAFVDLWEWDGDRWREIPLHAPNPGARYSPGLAFDSRRGRLVLYGGLVHDSSGRTRRMDDTWEWDRVRWRRIHLGDTWEWDGTAWRRVEN